MKLTRYYLVILSIVFFASYIYAQKNLDNGILYLRYERYNSAKDILSHLYNDNKSDAKIAYWYSQVFFDNGQVDSGRIVLQTALNSGVNDPWIWVGLAQADVLDDKDINAIKQQCDQAINTIKEKTKGKKKEVGKVIDILNAVGHAMADGSSKQGDPTYGIAKLKEAADLDKEKKEGDIFVNMGICYQKMGSDFGGQAVEAYQEGANRSPNDVRPYYHIGLIYASQNNEESMNDNFTKATTADPNFPPVYLAWFEFYKNTNTGKAKDYLDLYIQKADPNPKNDYYYADYLYQTAQFQQSITKAQQIEKEIGLTTIPRLAMLYAYNYYQLKDTILAKDYILKYIELPDVILKPLDMTLLVDVFKRFDGLDHYVVDAVNKAIVSDTSHANDLQDIYAASTYFKWKKDYPDQIDWLQKYYHFKGDQIDEAGYYELANAAMQEKKYDTALYFAQAYIHDYPNSPNGYWFNTNISKALDTLGHPGIVLGAIQLQDSFYQKDTTKYKDLLVANLYYLVQYYSSQIGKDPNKIDQYITSLNNALNVGNQILVYIPNDPDMVTTMQALQNNLTQYQKYKAYQEKHNKAGK